MEIENEIETMVAANQMEQKIMMIMPVMIVGMIKMLGEDLASNFVTPTGLVATTVGVIAFVTAYFVGKKILDIKAVSYTHLLCLSLCFSLRCFLQHLPTLSMREI